MKQLWQQAKILDPVQNPTSGIYFFSSNSAFWFRYVFVVVFFNLFEYGVNV